MKVEQVGVNMFSLSKFCETPEEARDSLRRVAEMGYKTVQISGAMARMTAAEIKPMTDEFGLGICCTHENGTTIVENPQQVVERLKALGTDLTAYPYPHLGQIASYEDCLTIARGLDAAGAVLREAGLTLMYHNHQIEFQRFGGKTALEIIYEQTDPENLQGEPDTHWVQLGGHDPAEWCRRLKGRMPVLHAKDYVITDQREVTKCPVGSGNLDWDAIFGAAEQAGCRFYVVEHDGGTFESVETSFKFITGNYCQ
jgi:sugar phosphate isomerase/epimerase